MRRATSVTARANLKHFDCRMLLNVRAPIVKEMEMDIEHKACYSRLAYDLKRLNIRATEQYRFGL